MNDDSKMAELPGEALLQVLEGAPDAILLADDGGILRFANRQTEAMFGYTREELIGQSIELLVPSAQRAGHGALRKRYMQTPSARPMGVHSALCGQRKNGETFAVEVSLSPILTAQGAFVAGAVRDVTERKRQAAAEQLANQRLLSAVDSIQALFALFDAEDRLVLCNSAFRQLFECSEGPVVERSFFELVNSARNLFADDVRMRWLNYHGHPEGTLDLRTEDGRSLRVAERSTPEGGRVTTVWDVSDDVGRERELEHARALAEAASAAKSDFLSSMSHELRTPMNAILGFAQLLARDRREPLTQRQRERIDQVLHAGQHLLRLIEDVLDLSRVEGGHLSMSLEEVGVGGVLEEVAATLEPLAAHSDAVIHLAYGVDEALTVRADRTRLIQILTNFGTNALKYGLRGGTVRFGAVRSDPSRVRLTVDDDGPGIAEAHQRTLFEPFQRAGQERGPIEGTGIGLAICKRLAGLMQGRVGLESRLGKGACFWVELPVAEPAPITQRPVARGEFSRSRLENVPRTILYVEDNPSNVAVMRELVRELESVELITATNAEHGIEIARSQLPSLIIMDINLPGISGWEAGRRLRAIPETRAIPIVALSAATHAPHTGDPAESPFAHYLSKPVELDELLQTLDSLMAPTTAES